MLNRSLILFIIGAVLMTVGLAPKFFTPPEARFELVASVDIGSTSTKLVVAKVREKKIESILKRELFHVSGEESGVVLKEVKKRVEEMGVSRLIVVGTSPFRKDPKLAEKILAASGVSVIVLSQEEEGRVGFLSASESLSIPKEKLLVWDIGGDSIQFTTAEKTYGLERGSEAFLLKAPLTEEKRDAAVKSAWALANTLPLELKKKAADPSVYTVGIGPLFSHGIKGESFSRSELEKRAYELEEPLVASEALLVLGFMEALKMRDVSIVDVSLAEGAILFDFKNHFDSSGK